MTTLCTPPTPTINNIVATANIGTPVDLKTIAMRIRNAEYRPAQFPAVFVRILVPASATVMIFAGGALVCTGGKSVHDARMALRKVCAVIRKVCSSDSIQCRDFNVRTVVAHVDLRFPVRLESLALTHPECATYEPEIFPGLVYRMPQPKLTLTIFTSGKVNVTGAKTIEDIQRALAVLYPALLEYGKLEHIPKS
jgi:transcription initiation factor TFIID TATA-box-binding protein